MRALPKELVDCRQTAGCIDVTECSSVLYSLLYQGPWSLLKAQNLPMLKLSDLLKMMGVLLMGLEPC